MQVTPAILRSYRERLYLLGLKSLKCRRIAENVVLSFRNIPMMVKLRASKYWILNPSRERATVPNIQDHKSKLFFFEKVVFNSSSSCERRGG